MVEFAEDEFDEEAEEAEQTESEKAMAAAIDTRSRDAIEKSQRDLKIGEEISLTIGTLIDSVGEALHKAIAPLEARIIELQSDVSRLERQLLLEDR